MHTSSTNAGCDISNKEPIQVKKSYRKSKTCLAISILCYFTFGILLFSQNRIITSTFFKQLSSLLVVMVGCIWRSSSIIITIFIILAALLFCYCIITKKTPLKYLQWLIHPPSSVKFSILSFFLIYTLFPLNWASTFNRSHDSALPYTPFDFFLVIILVIGIGLTLFFFFINLPEGLGNNAIRAASYFYNWRQSSLLITCLTLCFLLTNLFAYFALEHIPHVQDSIAQLFQAKIFKMGALSVPVPQHKEFFEYMNVINEERWYSQYPPGHPFLLMLGLYFRAPWIINPCLGVCSLIVLYYLAKNCYGDKRVSYLGIVFLLLSPFFLFMSASHMNHTSAMFFIILFIYCHTKTLQRPLWSYPLIGGLSLGFAISIRPLTAAAMGLPFCLDFILYIYKKRAVYLNKLLWFALGLSCILLLLLLYNQGTNGNPFLFGYQVKYNTLGFLGRAQMGPPHTLKGGIINTSNNLTALNKYLFAWPLPSLMFVFVLLLPWIEKNRWDWLFSLSSLTLVVCYFFYYYQDICFGPRFYFSSVPLLTLLTVRGFLKIPNILSRFSFNKHKVEATLYLFIMLCFIYTLVFSLPVLYKQYSHFYWHVDNALHKTVTRMKIQDAIVFVDVMIPPGTTVPNLPVYGSGFLYNSPDLHDSVIYALDLGEKNRVLMQAYPSREYYLWKFSPAIDDFKLIKIGAD